MKTCIGEAAGYGLASGIALLADMSILWCLVDGFGCNYLAAAAFSFLAGGFVAYEISVRIAFTQHRLVNRRAEMMTFIGIGVLGMMINATILFVGVNYLGLYFLSAKIVAAGGTFACNFAVRRQMLFVRGSRI